MEGFCQGNEENTICQIELKALKKVCFWDNVCFYNKNVISLVGNKNKPQLKET